MHTALDQLSLDALFGSARTHSAWLDRPVDDATLERVHGLMRMAPTSANCSPLRIVFVRSQEAKARLIPLLAEGNREKTRTAPLTAVFGSDTRFFEHLPKLFPHTDARSWFDGSGKEQIATDTAFRNSSLQAAYFMLAARALGLDCGPMSGFDSDAVDKEFFPGGRVKSNFLCNIGYGDASRLKPRSPRFEFGEVCQLL